MLLVVVYKRCNNLQQCEQKPHTCTSRTMTHVHLLGDHIVMRVRGYNSVMLRFSDHGRKEMLGVVSSKVLTSFRLRVCKRTQQVTPNNVGSCCTAMSHPFARTLRELLGHGCCMPDCNVYVCIVWSQTNV